MKSLIYILFLFVNFSYSQLMNINHPITIKLKDNNFKSGVIFSAGVGTSLYKQSLILPVNISLDFHQHINLSAGVDIYFIYKNTVTTKYSVNLIPNYVLKISNFLFFRAGIGISNWEDLLTPVFSTKFDFDIFKNNFLGIEIKSLVPIPLVDDNPHVPPMMLMLLNYSIRLQ